MMTAVGFWDYLFGERAEMLVPMPGGGTRKLSVTKKWIESMEQTGTIRAVPKPANKIVANVLHLSAQTTKLVVHFLSGSLSGADLEELVTISSNHPKRAVEIWDIDSPATKRNYDQHRDPESGQLYAVVGIENGKPAHFLTSRQMWESIAENTGAVEKV